MFYLKCSEEISWEMGGSVYWLYLWLSIYMQMYLNAKTCTCTEKSFLQVWFMPFKSKTWNSQPGPWLFDILLRYLDYILDSY